MKKFTTALKEILPNAILFGILGFLTITIMLLFPTKKGFYILIPQFLFMAGSMIGYGFWKKNSVLNYLKSFLTGIIVFVIMNTAVFINAINSNEKYDLLYPETNHFLLYLLRFFIIIGAAIVVSSILALFFIRRNKQVNI